METPVGFKNINDIDTCIDCVNHKYHGKDGQEDIFHCHKVTPSIEINIFDNTCDEFEQQ